MRLFPLPRRFLRRQNRPESEARKYGHEDKCRDADSSRTLQPPFVLALLEVVIINPEQARQQLQSGVVLFIFPFARIGCDRFAPQVRDLASLRPAIAKRFVKTFVLNLEARLAVTCVRFSVDD